MSAHRNRTRSANTKRFHFQNLRVSAKGTQQPQQQPYSFSDGGSFTEEDVRLSRFGITISSIQKSPVVEVEMSRSSLEIFNKVLGQGASGVVKLAVHKPTKRTVAVKVIPLNLEEPVRKKLLLELRTLYQCDHPNITRFFGGYLEDGSVSLVMEYMDGGTIAQLLATRGRMPENVIGKMASLLIPALVYIHKELHIVHRDIKPANILINSEGVVKLSDFGVSGKLSNTIGIATTFAGTMSYMSPERIQGYSHSTSSDIWSLALSLLECSLGHFPFISPDEDKSKVTFFELLERIQNFPTPSPPKDFSPEFNSFVQSCLTKNPDERPSSIELMSHPWILRYMDEPQTELRKYIHKTLWMQKRTYSCSPSTCGDCLKGPPTAAPCVHPPLLRNPTL